MSIGGSRLAQTTSPRSDSDVPSSGKLMTRSTTLPTSSMLGV